MAGLFWKLLTPTNEETSVKQNRQNNEHLTGKTESKKGSWQLKDKEWKLTDKWSWPFEKDSSEEEKPPFPW
jgi:hypothetical protein